MCWFSNLFSKPSPLELSPSDLVKPGGIKWDEASGKVEIDLSMLPISLNELPRVWIPDIPSTGSMLPNFSHEHNNILIAGKTETDHAKIIAYLNVGDIVVYRVMVNDDDDPADYFKPAKFYAIHRIVKMNLDDKGKYFTLKGDNNSVNDPYKAREKNILWVSIAIIY